MLIANLKAYLTNGNSVDLLPVQHDTDVKKEVSALLESWASSGFLIRDKFAYPWHQVQVIEVSVEKLSQQETAQRMLDLKGSDRSRLHDDFWQGERQL